MTETTATTAQEAVPQRIGSLSGCVITRNEGVSVVALGDNTIDAAVNPSTGVYYRDTRHLSRMRFAIDGGPLLFVDSSSSGPIQSALFANADPSQPRQSEVIPECAVVIRHRRLVDHGIREHYSLSNYSPSRRRARFFINFDADFNDIFEVRGYERREPRPPVDAFVEGGRVQFCYRGVDGQERNTAIEFRPPPSALTSTVAEYEIDLEPRSTMTIDITVSVDNQLRPGPIESALDVIQHEESRFLAGMTRITTDNEQVNEILRQGLLDIFELGSRGESGPFIAAGVPWFDALFGRDSLLTGIMLAPYSPGILRDALMTLAANQATGYDPARDAEPGKIPHELRWGELARAGIVPFGRYYGTVDATPLFIMGASEYFTWTNDTATMRQLWPALTRAKDWCMAIADASGFLTYNRESADGLVQQGWKDSWDAIVWPDGRMVEPPIALVEVQAYFIAALEGFALIGERLGYHEAEEARATAARVRQQFEERFANEQNGYAFCLDGHGVPVPTAVSNVGHVLWAGAASPERAGAVARRLLERDMFSGWGVRTLSTECVGFNPLGYHVGSVWPHDNAIIVGGLKRYGEHGAVRRLAEALFRAAIALPDHRLPELFSGDAREYRLVPTPYPVASRPQAWASASLPYVLAAMLGIRPAPGGQLAIVEPVLPGLISEVQVHDLRFRDGRVDLLFRRHQGRDGAPVSVEVGRVEGDIDVVLTRTWPRW